MTRARRDASDSRADVAASGHLRVVLAAYRGALARELHVLRRHPGLLWQQLHNRLQWEGEPVAAVLEPEFARRTAPGAPPWWRTRTRYRESEVLPRTLEGHSACAFSPDGARVLSGGAGNTLKLWDVETGEETRTFTGHTGEIRACAVSPDGARLLSASADKTLKLWDAETGRTLRTVGGHTDEVEACAFRPDGGRVVSAGRDGTLKLWDAETGEELRTRAERIPGDLTDPVKA